MGYAQRGSQAPSILRQPQPQQQQQPQRRQQQQQPQQQQQQQQQGAGVQHQRVAIDAEELGIPEHYRNSLMTFSAQQMIDALYTMSRYAIDFTRLCDRGFRDKGRGFLSFMIVHGPPFFDTRYMLPSEQETKDAEFMKLINTYNPNKAYIVRVALQPDPTNDEMYIVRTYALRRCMARDDIVVPPENAAATAAAAAAAGTTPAPPLTANGDGNGDGDGTTLSASLSPQAPPS